MTVRSRTGVGGRGSSRPSAAAVATTAASSYADDNGSTACFDAARGTVTAPATARFGEVITVSWRVTSLCYQGLQVLMDGPGSANGDTTFSGAFTVRADPHGQMMTYSLWLLNTISDTHESRALTTVSVWVP